MYYIGNFTYTLNIWLKSNLVHHILALLEVQKLNICMQESWKKEDKYLCVIHSLFHNRLWFRNFFIVTGFCLFAKVKEAVHFLWSISEHANAFAGVCAQRVFVCVKPDQGDGSLAFYLRLSLSLSLARSPAATFALVQSNGERSNQTTRGPHSSSYLSPLLLLFEPGWVCLQWKNIRQLRRTPILLRIDPL